MKKKHRQKKKKQAKHIKKAKKAEVITVPKVAEQKKSDPKKRVILVIMDGVGVRASRKDNAVKLAKTPNLTLMQKKYPSGLLDASAHAVGLPKGQMGNSEVGHMTIGAGRIIQQEYMIISRAIHQKKFFRNKVLVNAFKSPGRLHLMGLVSDGGVHSHIEDLLALIKMARKYKKHINVHAFLDGRDTEKKSAEKFLRQTEKALKGIGEIATISGRYYAMDRDERWDRTEKAYNCITKSYCIFGKDPYQALNDAYTRGESDEFVSPALTSPNYHGVSDGDTMLFFNFREDRARQLTRAFVDEEFMHFNRPKKKVNFVCMTRYDSSIKNIKVAFEQQKPNDLLGEVISDAGLKQLRTAETEKYAHVTFFFNCTHESPFKGEDRVLIHSPHVATYDFKPEMSAFEVKDAVVKGINSGNYDLIAVNFANGDMVGHTGILEAAIKAMETVDQCVGEIVYAGLKKEYNIIITADHGNCEEMSGPHQTTHTLNPVPFILVFNRRYKIKKRGALYNIAPTVLQLVGLKRPKEMEKSMIVK